MTERIAITEVELELVAGLVFVLGAHGLLIKRLDGPARVLVNARRGVVAAQHGVGASRPGLQHSLGHRAVGVADLVASRWQLQPESEPIVDYRILLVVETIVAEQARIAGFREVPFLE